jgi:TPR repeat protein
MNDKFFKKALIEAKNKNFEAAYTLFHKSHELGNPMSTYAIGTWYLHGRYVEVDMKKAVVFLAKAAKKNVPEALYDLAVCYELGKGIKKNLKQSFENYLKAALCGEQQSIYEVGRCYHYGIGVKKDARIGKIWLNHAKKLGLK